MVKIKIEPKPKSALTTDQAAARKAKNVRLALIRSTLLKKAQ